MAVNKVIYDGKTLIDLTNDTVTEDDLPFGVTAHDASGKAISGTRGIPTEQVDSSAEFTDTSKLYSLPDGSVYAYVSFREESEPEELYDPAASDLNVRQNSSTAIVSNPGYFLTDFIPIDMTVDDPKLAVVGKVNIRGETATYPHCLQKVGYYNADKAALSSDYIDAGHINVTHSDDTVTIHIRKTSSYSASIAYVRIDCYNSGNNATLEDAQIIESIYNPDEEGSVHFAEWVDTGLHRTRDKDMPSYWIAHLAEKAERIRLAMEGLGRNRSAFLWYTDAHLNQGGSGMAPILLRYLYRQTAMNKVNFGGDVVGNKVNGAIPTEDLREIYCRWRASMKDLPNHHSVVGNHDYFVSNPYAFLIAPEESADMVMGDKYYYYIDNPCECTRYLYLDNLATDTSKLDGAVDNSKLVEQANFVKQALSTLPDGWHAVAISHMWFWYSSSSTPTVGVVPNYVQEMFDMFDDYNARATKGTVSGAYFHNYDFSAATGKVELCIGGHLHVDYDFTTDGGIPVIITAADANQERSPEDTEDSGVIGTATESAVFGIVADYEKKTITVVGVGRGTHRKITY